MKRKLFWLAFTLWDTSVQFQKLLQRTHFIAVCKWPSLRHPEWYFKIEAYIFLYTIEFFRLLTCLYFIGGSKPYSYFNWALLFINYIGFTIENHITHAEPYQFPVESYHFFFILPHKILHQTTHSDNFIHINIYRSDMN